MINKIRCVEVRHSSKPGSLEAVKDGCTCNRVLNKDGKDKQFWGYVMTIVNSLCILHGNAWEKAASKSLH